MGDSKEQSPDWLRSFQAPNYSLLTLSSDSGPSPSNSPVRDEDNHNEDSVAQEVHNRDPILLDSEEESPIKKVKKASTPKKGKQVEDHNIKEGIGGACEEEGAEEEISKKPVLPNVSSRLPLILPEKVQRSKALVECDGDIDLSGDVGAVGRVIISKSQSGSDEMLLDLKGTVYQSTIVPSTAFCVVSFGQTEAKIESIMTDYVQLKQHSNVFEAETMIEGTLDGFSFDSEEEGDRLLKATTFQSDKGNENGDQANENTGKVEKLSGVSRKKAKTAAKPVKRGVRKPQNTKKGNSSKK